MSAWQTQNNELKEDHFHDKEGNIYTLKEGSAIFQPKPYYLVF